MVVRNRVLSMGQINLNYVLMLNCDCYIVMFETNCFAKKSQSSFINGIQKMCLQIIYIFNIYVQKGFGIK